MNSILFRLFIAYLAALILTIAPLPEILVQVRPPWIFLIGLYLQLYLPNYFKLAILFFSGLMLDSLLSTVIGEHAFSLCFVAWLVSSKARRFSFFPLGQQMMFVGFFAMIYQLIIVLIDSFLGYRVTFLTVIGVGLLSVLFWPWIRLMGEEFLLTVKYSRSK